MKNARQSDTLNQEKHSMLQDKFVLGR
ncbi:MAG: hypothetical protein QG632_485, partial [Candidatus Dependentiae bacterium]|nr:hypothetical protein [Candidatus Dependentiae bacterium]